MKTYKGQDLSISEFKRSLKELGSCFIKISNYLDEDSIDFFNPSIHDFLVSYIQDDRFLVQELINYVVFINTVNLVFTNERSKNKIQIENDMEADFYQRLIDHFDALKVYFTNEEQESFNEFEIIVVKLINLDRLAFRKSDDYFVFLENWLQIILSNEIERIDNRVLKNFLELFIKYVNIFDLNITGLIERLADNTDLVDNLEIINVLSERFPVEFRIYFDPVLEGIFRPIVADLRYSIDDYDNYKNYQIKEQLEFISENYRVAVDWEISEVIDQINKIKEREERRLRIEYDKIAIHGSSREHYQNKNDSFPRNEVRNPKETNSTLQEEAEIIRMFERLKGK